MSSGGKDDSKVRKISFISEGVTDLESQKAREQASQNKYEDEQKRKERKSLRAQLRSNAISKQKQYNALVKERDSFNRLSSSELKFFQDIQKNEEAKEKEIEEQLEKGISKFEFKKAIMLQNRSEESEIVKSLKSSSIIGVKKSNQKLGIVKNSKKARKSIKIKVPARPDTEYEK
ncbi:hypothetical protein Kpol_1048p7 [Vanderwaltozyma polyspora DSM 70294]|uniref:FAM192A/Fyv6 N-terminal domain-containing protein n=1 Tax=Vanderwaltozyma polyspora (strain ATCC 22028 / DSM 70294 / BCRC 21397 / CBS 2163 / NBRC 10782 / NRRL Y-8283 / UCD 57-17) TaxID=436907 RepID=A7TGH0_VANPO|nr:uncharacterized protein Kpol_1048p7 [Vanderwaltozyma polyspora DSM 70294]EDO18577.1 hypothetical protein Kpol_1048p7 [Vanderwaltozyma polyspora DSM 70294]